MTEVGRLYIVGERRDSMYQVTFQANEAPLNSVRNGNVCAHN
jgi:hypothetical protein